jgi:hypothetical protein
MAEKEPKKRRKREDSTMVAEADTNIIAIPEERVMKARAK